ncbi:MAG TPA: MlaD family protein [Aeromicrobium sp.]|nr:MlaD family protein [Aeromicrobium sp.]
MTTARDRAFFAAAIKLGIFCVVSVMVTALLAIIMGRLGAEGKTEYHALFTTASELADGDDVRVAGVSVGEVSAVDVTDSGKALVTFRVDNDLPLTRRSEAEVRYLNLVGARYMALKRGPADSDRLPAGGTLGESQTTPAINLTELFNGFQPLFQALNPKDVNQLAANLVAVLQGEGGTIASLLSNVGSLTNTLADRDQLITQVIGNLTRTLETIDNRHKELGDLLTGLNKWMGDLADDRDVIGESVGQIDEMSDELARLLVRLRPNVKADLEQLHRMLVYLNRPENQAIVDETLHRLPTTLRLQARIGTHGSWYNYYLCDFDGKITLPKFGPAIDNSPVVAQLQQQLGDLAVYSTAKRCDP